MPLIFFGQCVNFNQLNKNMIITIHSLAEVGKAAKEFIRNMGNNKVFAFYGEMGTGKTTFIKAICRELGVDDNITSPTFALVNEYLTNAGESVYHFDCYRLKSIEEAYDIGAEEYFYSGNICFIEWPNRIEPLLPDHYVEVKINLVSDTKREVQINTI